MYSEQHEVRELKDKEKGRRADWRNWQVVEKEKSERKGKKVVGSKDLLNIYFCWRNLEQEKDATGKRGRERGWIVESESWRMRIDKEKGSESGVTWQFSMFYHPKEPTNKKPVPTFFFSISCVNHPSLSFPTSLLYYSLHKIFFEPFPPLPWLSISLLFSLRSFGYYTHPTGRVYLWVDELSLSLSFISSFSCPSPCLHSPWTVRRRRRRRREV